MVYTLFYWYYHFCDDGYNFFNEISSVHTRILPKFWIKIWFLNKNIQYSWILYPALLHQPSIEGTGALIFNNLAAHIAWAKMTWQLKCGERSRMMKQSELSSLVGQRSPTIRMQNDTSVESKHDSVVSAFQRAGSFARSVRENEVTLKVLPPTPGSKMNCKTSTFNHCELNFLCRKGWQPIPAVSSRCISDMPSDCNIHWTVTQSLLVSLNFTSLHLHLNSSIIYPMKGDV